MLEKVEEPTAGDVASELERLRVVALELMAEPIGQPHALVPEVIAHPRPLAQLEDGWILGLDQPESVAVSAQGIGEDASVQAVVLGARHGEPISEPVELFGGLGGDGGDGGGGCGGPAYGIYVWGWDGAGGTGWSDGNAFPSAGRGGVGGQGGFSLGNPGADGLAGPAQSTNF